MKDYLHTTTLKVRDYECDLQGIVNNANYQHYIEHARHEFLLSYGVSFADLHNRGIDAVVARISMAYKQPLRPGDEFIVATNIRKDGLKYVFLQDIYRASDEKLCFTSEVTTVTLINGRLSDCPELNETFGL
ncbi:MAG: acyl-CoA thioesterase [Bacteroidales bacterium]|nr:acyl-CoA thioesterase [Bacteroidales bacterium]